MATTIPAGEPEVSGYRPRNYQLEMFEASLKSNIIVAMDTGSGKTHIALLRIIHELENPDRNKVIWFLAPTVALCIQQHEVITRNIPAARSRTLTGLDKVELWTEQSVWDEVLKDIQVVISTHAVLTDAMTHGFIKISQLGLIVFDEAHHCRGKHPANRIMQDFYHPVMAKHGPEAVPRILGLTASPVVRSNQSELLRIEKNLDAVCKTPRIHRHELLAHTHRPELHRILYTPVTLDAYSTGSTTFRSLIHAWTTRDIEQDPHVKRLRRGSLEGQALQKVLLTGKTYCSEQLRRFVDRTQHIFEELGQWAADYFIWASTEQLRARVHDGSLMMDCDEEEKGYLLDLLSQLPPPILDFESTDPAKFPISPKLEALISFLTNVSEGEFSGLVFAQQRATVGVMAKLLSYYPLTKDRFRTAGYVGLSSNTSRKDGLGELLTLKMQAETLDDFRGGRKNLIIATDVLEEGIDVSACSIVVCYNKPPNLKSFVQRRGRARRQQSTYAILFSSVDDDSNLHKWQDLEKAMIEAYQDDQRRLEEVWNLETEEEEMNERLCVEHTGAVLTPDNVMQHLYHFCSILPRQAHVDNRPEFAFETVGTELKGKVTLPSCVHPAVRCAEGKRCWKTERAARKEAAFQCYKALYEFGLVNDNLLPLTEAPELGLKAWDILPSILQVREQYDPWVDWAYSWSSPHIHQSRVVVRQEGGGDRGVMKLVTPTIPPLIEPLTLFWDSDNTFTVDFEPAERVPDLTAEGVENLRITTALYLQATTTRRLGQDRDFITLFSPDLSQEGLATWLQQNAGHEPATDVFARQQSVDLMGIVRDRSRYDEVLIFKRWVVSGLDNPTSSLQLECDSFPKRRNLLHQQTLAMKRPGVGDDGMPESPVKKRIIAAEHCTIDRLPAMETIFGRFIAVIIDRLEATLVATKLCETILQTVSFTHTRHVITAITTPYSQGLTNYQRYEFLGDSVLKFTVSCALFYKNPGWHEGLLSLGRDAVVHNGRLARAALDSGLDAYIIHKMFTPRKWSAPLISDRLATSAGQRPLSSKVLADVVEALIGAAYIEGGLEKAQRCIHRFLPEIILRHEPKSTTQTAPDTPKPQPARPIQHESLERGLEYSFADRTLLLEALTHASCQHDASVQSYQRLEFLGDAVLDMIIVQAMLQHPTEIAQGQMTRVKHAVVNANLLAFFCMQFSWPQERTHIISSSTTTTTTTTTPSQPAKGTKPHSHTITHISTTRETQALYLWQFIRYDGLVLTNARECALGRYDQLHDEIAHRLAHDDSYPWEILSQLNPDKFFSDIVESVLGALFVDSRGDLAVCTAFVERIGLLGYLRRILAEEVDVMHPRNVAQQMAKGDMKLTVKRVQKDGAEATYRSTVKLNGHPEMVVEGCSNSEEAEIKASNRAIEILQRQAALNFD